MATSLKPKRRALGKQLVMQRQFRSQTEKPKKGKGSYNRKAIKKASKYSCSEAFFMAEIDLRTTMKAA
ncbi:alternative ribosome rescue factor ArfA [Zooshikella harenae]|uniref:Ribosome alternative rescue factor ArfA n=1 Tax=Zooshikella harenae TaxID=2827238 RepID=A0ABS5Z7X8_9GAMM|nr:alternative ribosome rescue factor ArfA [Zooshikella harenae]MBU2710038.1 ribosome alternative rescue factor ArfA [Zooshikella harenae]